MGEGSGKHSGGGESYAYSWETDALGRRTKEDRRCAEGAMGTCEGGEDRLSSLSSVPITETPVVAEVKYALRTRPEYLPLR